MLRVRHSTYRTLTRAGMVFAIGATLALAFGILPKVQAQVGHNGDLSSAASTAGYSAGYSRGVEDKNRRAAYDYQNDETYRAGSSGYDERMGDRGQYESVFRQVYSRGYSDGYNGRASYSDNVKHSGYGDRQERPVPRRLSSYDILGIATASGYHDGFERGTSNRSARLSSVYRRDDEYQRATSGYDNGWNIQGAYQSAYRRGYARGFNDGYSRRVRNDTYEATYREHRESGYNYRDESYSVKDYRPGDADSDSLARRSAETGYRDGYQRGQYDRRAGVRPPNPQGHGAYEFGLDGWEQGMGDRSAYQLHFREYFIRGYQDGYDGQTANFTFRQ